MSMTEILDELPRLNDGERRAILRRLAELDPGIALDETPEMLAAFTRRLATAFFRRGVKAVTRSSIYYDVAMGKCFRGAA